MLPERTPEAKVDTLDEVCFGGDFAMENSIFDLLIGFA
jgi:hypothetical protein